MTCTATCGSGSRTAGMPAMTTPQQTDLPGWTTTEAIAPTASLRGLAQRGAGSEGDRAAQIPDRACSAGSRLSRSAFSGLAITGQAQVFVSGYRSISLRRCGRASRCAPSIRWPTISRSIALSLLQRPCSDPGGSDTKPDLGELSGLLEHLAAAVGDGLHFCATQPLPPSTMLDALQGTRRRCKAP